MEESTVPVKEKRKNSEKRKEKSRDAARCRRSKESEIFTELASVLPLPLSVVSHLDKASIMRLIITNLRLINVFKSIDIPKSDEPKFYDSLYLKATGGFTLILSLDGDIIFISQNVSAYLGITQVDLLGQSVYDISHPCDHSEVHDLFSGKIKPNTQKTFFMRMKCLSSKGRGINTKSSSYKVLHIVGRFVKVGETEDNYSFVAVATPIPHPIDIELPLGTFTFLSKHSLDMKFTYADERMKDFLGYNPDSLLGKSMFDFHHAQDNRNIDRAFRGLFAKGQSDTGQYRFLAQGGGYVWVSTQATVIYCEKNSRPQSVVCVNYIVSEKCEESKIYSSDQLEYRNKQVPSVDKRPVSSTSKLFVNIKTEAPSPKPLPVTPSKTDSCSSPRPQPATNKIFAPRTADMNIGGFLAYSDDDTGSTNITDEFDDLTHLAPTAGDTCVPLDTPLISDVVQNMLPTSSCPLIDSGKNISFFTTYKEEGSDSCLSPSLCQSPCGVPSLCPMGDDSPSFDDPTMKSLLGLDIDSNDEDISFKSPYIPLGEDELPLLLPLDIPWDFTSVSSESSSPGSLSPMDMKNEENLSNFEQLLHTDMLTNNSDLLHSKMAYDSDSRKRVSSIAQEGVKKRKHQSVQDPGGGGNSVLMNLLVAGCDLSAGYICVDPRKSHSEKNSS